MRNFLNTILLAIQASTLTDNEFGTIDPDLAYGWNAETYNALLKVLDSRELVSNDRDRLTGLFVAKGVSVTPTEPARSNIFIGAPL